MAARNSEALEVLLRIASDNRVSWRAVKLAGRGIAADASGTLWVLSEGKTSISGDVLADLLIRQGELVDELIEVWRLFDNGSLSGFDFEIRLESVINALELWPGV